MHSKTPVRPRMVFLQVLEEFKCWRQDSLNLRLVEVLGVPIADPCTLTFLVRGPIVPAHGRGVLATGLRTIATIAHARSSFVLVQHSKSPFSFHDHGRATLGES